MASNKTLVIDADQCPRSNLDQNAILRALLALLGRDWVELPGRGQRKDSHFSYAGVF